MQQETKDITGNHFKVGDVVPYINTAQKISWCKITDFENTTGRNPIWFRGFDTKTEAKVWYSEFLSHNYFSFAKEYAAQLTPPTPLNAEERAKELYPDGLLMQEVNISTYNLQLGKQKAYLAGHKEANADAVGFAEWLLSRNYDNDRTKWLHPVTGNKYTSEEVYEQYLKSLNK